MIQYQLNIETILQAHFPCAKEELIQNAAKMICNLTESKKIRKAGKWLEYGDYECSLCGCVVYPLEIENGAYNYCPNCGAKMEVKEDE